MKITADENIPLVREAFAGLGEVNCKSGRDITAADVQDAELLLVRSVTQVNKALLAGSSVKFVASATAGFDHLDVTYLQNRGIGFARAPGSNALSAAEYVIAALCYWSIRSGQPLHNLTLGIIGCGQVGSRVAKIAAAFGLACVRNDPPLQEKGGENYQSLDEALACDIVTVHVPLEHSGAHPTYELIEESAIEKLKANAVFINASRGEVLCESALLQRLKNRSDLTVILDVWRNEPHINTNILAETFLATPHIAGYSYDGKIRGTLMIYQACAKFFGCEALWNPILPSTEITAQEEFRSNNEILQAVLKAYDIKADDERMRKMLSGDVENRAAYFDQLRRSYPVRREYSGLLFRDVSGL